MENVFRHEARQTARRCAPIFSGHCRSLRATACYCSISMNIQEKLLIRDLRRILHVLPSWVGWRVYGLFFLMILLAVFEVVSIFSMSLMAMSIAAPQAILSHWLVQSLFRMFPAVGELCSDLRYFTLLLAWGVVACTAVKNGLAALVGWKSAILGEDITLSTGSTIMRHFLYSDYMEHMAGNSMAVFQALSWKGMLGQYVVNILNVYTYAITSLALFLTLVTATPGVILGTLLVTGLITTSIYRGMKSAIDRAGKESAAGQQQENSTAMIAMNGIREVLIYRQQGVFFQKYMDACQDGRKARAFLTIAPPIPTWILEIFGFLVIPVTIWALIASEDASMPVISGVITVIMLAAWRVLPLLNRSLGCLVTLRGLRVMAMNCLERLESISQQKLSPPPEPDPDFCFRQDIALDHVDFRYPGAERDSLSQLCVSIRKGEQIGIVGPSGAGKSTLVGLLCGLLGMSGGALRVDGRELSPEARAAYISRIGYVPQTPYLLQGSVAANVAFSQWGSPYDVEKVRRACRMAALDIVETNPSGIEYQIGERGAGLSGGQAQRVSIARALYAEPEILILDESTSALDLGTESAIMDTIAALKGQLTIIIIAHRLSTVENCDRLVWMEKGRVKCVGTPQEILPLYTQSFAASAESAKQASLPQTTLQAADAIGLVSS